MTNIFIPCKVSSPYREKGEEERGCKPASDHMSVFNHRVCATGFMACLNYEKLLIGLLGRGGAIGCR